MQATTRRTPRLTDTETTSLYSGDMKPNIVKTMVQTAFNNGTKPVRIAEKASAFAKTELGQQLAYLNEISTSQNTAPVEASIATKQELFCQGLRERSIRKGTAYSNPHLSELALHKLNQSKSLGNLGRQHH